MPSRVFCLILNLFYLFGNKCGKYKLSRFKQILKFPDVGLANPISCGPYYRSYNIFHHFFYTRTFPFTFTFVPNSVVVCLPPVYKPNGFCSLDLSL